MRKPIAMLLLLSSLSGALGCAGRHARPRLVNVTVSRGGLTEDPVLLECDLSYEPPKCKKIKLVYKKGSETIHLQ